MRIEEYKPKIIKIPDVKSNHPTIREPKIDWSGLKKLGSAMSDPDKDGYPNAIDCVDHNPNKQGFKDFIGNIKQKIRDYKEKEPERRAQKLEDLQYRTQLMQERQKQAELRASMQSSQLSIQERRTKLMAAKQRAMPRMPSMMNPFGVPAIPIRRKTTARRTRRKKRR